MDLNKFLSLLILLIAYAYARVMTADENVLIAGEESIYINNNIKDISEQEVQGLFKFIFPGTKWCGTGNIAVDYKDLGIAWEADMCCRDHDNCQDLILAGETKFNLTNEAFYTRLSCECDEKFRQCLLETNSRVANKVGKIYFNVLGTQCYKMDYPIKKCNKRGGWFDLKCVEYELDTNSEMKYQWFDINQY